MGKVESASTTPSRGDTPAADPPAANPPAADPPVADPPAANPSAADPPAADPPAANPSAADPPVADLPAANPSAADPPAADPPVADPPAADPPAADPPVADPPAADPPAADPPAADPPAKRIQRRRYNPKGRKAKAESTIEGVEPENFSWTTGDPHEWPWPTYELPNGGALMAEKTTNRMDSDKNPISYYLVELRVEVEGLGVLYQHKLVRYSDYPGEIDAWKEAAGEERCKFAATDKPDSKEKLRNGKSYEFERLDFIASLTPGSKDPTKGSQKRPETECIVAVKGHEKPIFLTMGEFFRMVGKRKAESLIIFVCNRDGMSLPGKTEARRISYMNPACPDNTESLEFQEKNKPIPAQAVIQQSETAVPDEHLKRTVREMLAVEKQRVDVRFQKIESDVYGVKSTLHAHGGYLQSILSLLQENLPNKNPDTQPRDTIPVGRKLMDVLQGSGNSRQSEREQTLPPYTSPSPEVAQQQVQRSIEV
ncbi:hypothetical protein BDV36DRAFT_292393 [Aspergillus pseudocaelatus]|uniref:Uncharacterized protein n=1 Tax=Aspergillus pseudocaelatus TaxID=1825620 RepID=A0ABQ6X099_9EURO|nr:hypothetical protein BDV36DRAFT_292393 [Aspergillus pseudocaelatus]